MADVELVHAYRRLLRAGLRAVQFSKPARYALTEQLRAGFRDTHGDFNLVRIKRTVAFFNAAAAERGLEHRIVRNLLRVSWERTHRPNFVTTWDRVLQEQNRRRPKPPDPIKETAFKHYDSTIAMLNDTMGLCLR